MRVRGVWLGALALALGAGAGAGVDAGAGGGARAADARAATRIVEETVVAWKTGRVAGDANVRFDASGLRFAMRRRDEGWAGFAEIARGRSLRVLAGDLEAQWATGRLLRERAGFSAFERRPASLARPLLHARGTIATRWEERRGCVAAAAWKAIDLAAWDVTGQIGAALAAGPVGLAVTRACADGRREWIGSVVVAGPLREPVAEGADEPLPAASGDGFALELAGAHPVKPAHDTPVDAPGDRIWVAGDWRIRVASALGAVAGAFQFPLEPAAVRAPLDEPQGWSLQWALPWVRAIAPQVTWLARRLPAASAPHAMVERSVRANLATEPWSGAVLRFTIGSTHTEACATARPSEEREFVDDTGALLEVRADVRLARTIVLASRFRRSVSGRVALAEGSPLGIPARAMQVEEADDAGDETIWERETGGLTWVQVVRDDPALWGGCALAMAPRTSGGTTLVPVRYPTGLIRWHALASGAWRLQLWIGRRLGRLRIEGVMSLDRADDREAGGEADRASALELMLGVQHRMR
jgi:hypothetical protein